MRFPASFEKKLMPGVEFGNIYGYLYFRLLFNRPHETPSRAYLQA